MNRFFCCLSQAFHRVRVGMLLPVGLLGLGMCALGCSSDEPPLDGCSNDCPKTQNQDLMTPPASFTAEVMPLFARSCNQQLCHGNPQSARGDLYLGPAAPPTEADLGTVHTALLRSSKTAPVMPLVTPGLPQQSFLMAKVEGCQNSQHLTCQAEANVCGAPCGDGMPPPPMELYPPLTNEEKLLLRRWIAQGALRQ